MRMVESVVGPSLLACVGVLVLGLPQAALAQASTAPAASEPAACPKNDSGLTLPRGFCASLFADGLGHARHMAVAGNGVVYVNTWSGRYYVGAPPEPAGGFVVALQDTTGAGQADVVQRFGGTLESGNHGGTGIALFDGSLYVETNDRIVRYRLEPGSIVPSGPAQVVVSGLPLGGDHPMHPFAIDADGNLFVDVASATNACQKENRQLQSPGIKPCVELETRAGIWRYDARRTDQMFSPAERYATGIRNADGITLDDTGHGLYATQHGRDQLSQNWPKLFTPEQGAILPAEELLKVQQGGDYGWPECYYDAVRRKLMLAPEYGGNGKRVGACAHKIKPAAAFQAHWAPNDVLLYSGTQFPARYRGGAFIAFHGSWNRAPFAQGGYNLVFQPLANGKASGPCQIFAAGFAEGHLDPGAAVHRPSGLAMASDGSLYVSDDVRGRIYRITYRGGASNAASESQLGPCPNASTPPAHTELAAAQPPEGTNAGAGATAQLPRPPGATRADLVLGDRIYHGAVAAGACAGCHGADGHGTPLGPDLTSKKYLWGDGSYESIRDIVMNGVLEPKQFRSGMPPMGGAQLSPEQVTAVSAYAWALSHAGG